MLLLVSKHSEFVENALFKKLSWFSLLHDGLWMYKTDSNGFFFNYVQ